MKKQISVPVLFSLLLMIFFTSCSLVTEKPREDYLNAGDKNLSVTGKEFDPSTQFRHQFTLYRFDTANAGHTLILPSAAQIVGELTTPYVGELVVFGVAADGANPVIIEARCQCHDKTQRQNGTGQYHEHNILRTGKCNAGQKKR